MADEDDLVEAFTAEDPTVMQEESHLMLLKRKSSKRCCIISFIVVAICLAVTVVVVVALAVALAMGNSEEHKPTTSPSDVCLTESCVQLAAKVLSGLDQSINPCQDFYNFTCGNWIYNTIIPQGSVLRILLTITFVSCLDVSETLPDSLSMLCAWMFTLNRFC